MNINRLLKYVFSLACVVLLLTACGADDTASSSDKESSAQAYATFSTRAHGTTPSLNADAIDFEDKVNTLRLLAFNQATGELVYNYKLTDIAGQTSYTKKLPIKPGTYDFYFVANEYASMATALENITFVDALYQVASLAKIPYDFALVNTANPADRTPFLMTAVVKNQTVGLQHIESNPLPVHVELVRALAKSTVDIAFNNGRSDERTFGLTLDKVVLTNVPETYSLFPPRTSYTGAFQTTENVAISGISEATLNASANRTMRKIVYIPEYLAAAARPQASSFGLAFHYSKHGISKSKTLTIDHLNALTTPEALSRYSVVRNHDYTLTVNLKGWDEELIKFNWRVLPWNLVKSVKDFADAVVTTETGNFAVDNVGVSIDPTAPNLLRVHAGTTNKVTFRFKIANPPGAVYRFSIDNSLDFKLEVKDLTTGLLVPHNTGVLLNAQQPVDVEVVVTALKPYVGVTRSTELYLTVNGTEVQIVPSFKAANEESGPTKRYLIHQTF